MGVNEEVAATARCPSTATTRDATRATAKNHDLHGAAPTRPLTELGIDGTVQPGRPPPYAARMRTRFVADHLLTMAPTAPGSLDVHSPGALDVVDGTVEWSGPADAAPPMPIDARVDVAGVLMPGMVDIHAHTPMLLFRGTGEGLPTDRWLTDVMWPREARLTDDDVHWAMRHGAGELLRNGVTTTSEMYFYGDAIARAAEATGLRCVVAAPLIESAGFAALGSIGSQIEAIHELRRQWAGHPTIEIAIGPHAAYSLSRTTLERVAAAAAAADPMLVHIHVAEQPGEAHAVEQATGVTVPAYLDQLGLLGPRTVAAHCVWVTSDDIDLLAERGVGVAHCPASNGRHASGLAPVDEMRARGIRVGIATDGPASHDRLDLFEEARTAARYARIRAMDAGRMSAVDLLSMLTSEAADALGRPDLGRLTPGARADMVALDLRDDGFDPVFDPTGIAARIVWAGSRSAVRGVWVEGVQVVEHGRCTRFDRDEARAHVIESATRLAAS